MASELELPSGCNAVIATKVTRFSVRSTANLVTMLWSLVFELCHVKSALMIRTVSRMVNARS